MQTKLATTSKWAVIGAIVGIGLAGVNFAVGQAGVQKPPAMDGWRAAGRYDTENWPQMKFDLTIENTQSTKREVSITVRLTRQEFRGNPGSRVSRPGDVVTKELETQSFNASVGGEQSKTFPLRFKSVPDQTSAPKLGTPRVIYMMSATFDGKPRAFAQAMPKPTR
ncbi:MAG: hypothetical protein ACHQ50_07020 [Fimbriimonadales bacterium]